MVKRRNIVAPGREVDAIPTKESVVYIAKTDGLVGLFLHLLDPCVHTGGIERRVIAGQEKRVRDVSSECRVAAELRHDAIDNVQAQDGADHGLPGHPPVPSLLFPVDWVAVGCDGDRIGRIAHAAVDCPVDTLAMEDLAGCSKSAILLISTGLVKVSQDGTELQMITNLGQSRVDLTEKDGLHKFNAGTRVRGPFAHYHGVPGGSYRGVCKAPQTICL